MNEQIDALSEKGRQLLRLNSQQAYERLVVEGGGNEEAKQLLRDLKPADLLARPVKRTEDAQALHSALWLWHDWLDESHTISQQIHSATGSFWHAIMHRREGDFSNSKYWYARCRNHPSLAVIGAQAGPVINQMQADKALLRLVAHGWDSDAFVDFVEAVHDRPEDPRHRAAVSLQQLEWRVLFDDCARNAGGI
jgi:hypothetical protein